MKRVALCLLLTVATAAAIPAAPPVPRGKTTPIKKEKSKKPDSARPKAQALRGATDGQIIREPAGMAVSGVASPEIAKGPAYSSVPEAEHPRQREREEHVIPVRQGQVWDSIPAPSVPPMAPAATPLKGAPQSAPALATDFRVQTTTALPSSAAPSRSAIGEPSVASLGNSAIFYTGNWYAARSLDGGQTFSYVDPYNTFPSVNGGFCCDQVAHAAPAQNMLLWALQYNDDTSSNTLRIARTIGSTGLANNTWVSYTFTPQTFGFPTGTMLDFPNLTVGTNYLYVTTNVFSLSTNLFVGAVILRIPLAELAGGGTINYQYYPQNRLESDVGGIRCTEGAQTTMYCAGHRSTSQVRIFEWADTGTTIPSTTVTVQPYSYIKGDTPAVATSPDGTNWAGHVDSGILGSWVSNGVIGLMWSARQDSTFPYPYVVVARFNASTKSLISQTPIYSNDTAWLYPAASVNASGNVAGLLSYGGGQYYPGTNIWISDDVQSGFSPLALYGAAAGNSGPFENEWGDYQSVRPHGGKPNTWVASTHVMAGGGLDSNAVPVFLWFGRERDLGTTCTYSISPTSRSVTAASTTGTVSVTATTGCGWAATSNVSWLSVTGGGSGNGNGTVSYSVAANTSTSQRSGTLTVAGQTFTITQAGATCSYSISPTSSSAASGGATGSVTVSAGAGCGWTAASNSSFIAVTSGASGTGASTVGYSVAANTSASSRTGTVTIAGQTFMVTQAGVTCTYSISPTGNSVGAGGATGIVAVTAATGCGWTATSNASWLSIMAGAAGSGGGTVSYSVAANTTTGSRTGTLTAAGQTFTVTQAGASTPTVQFSASTYFFSEGAGSAVITATRGGNTSGISTVTFRTVDATDAIPCDPTILQPNGQPYPSGKAFARCDYATVVDTITFAPGETSKQVPIPLIDDAHVEGGETFQVSLSSPSVGTALGAPSTTTITILDNDVLGQTNPILITPFFVRQHYLDFFGREPDAGGFNAWKATLDNCPNPFNTSPTSPSATCDRVSVSTKFFRSKEFELKGGYVLNFYKAALGRLPLYNEFIPDISSLIAVDDAGFFAKKAAFTNAFVQRQEFKNLYDPLANPQYVSALMDKYGLQQVTTPDPANPDGTAKVTLTRTDLTNRLNAGTMTRAQVLRAIAGSDQVIAAEANSSFVAMQYFGYLRRDPDQGGYNDWLRTINANPADIRSMVNGFVNSREYRLRFGN